jgi:hypothetical protein
VTDKYAIVAQCEDGHVHSVILLGFTEEQVLMFREVLLGITCNQCGKALGSVVVKE